MSTKTIYPLLLSGGSGNRLWPVSRENQPKQFLSFFDKYPMIIETAKRVKNINFTLPTIVCNNDHRFLVAEALRSNFIEYHDIIVEPCKRDTAAAIALGVSYIKQRDPDAVIIVLPSDHVISDVDGFVETTVLAQSAAENGHIVTFGIQPNRAETGYGYIELEDGCSLNSGHSYPIKKFYEKPDFKTAQYYFERGNYFWNSGMFMFNVAVATYEFEQHAPKIWNAAQQAISDISTDLDFVRVDARSLNDLENTSFDVAVMENTTNAVCFPIDIGWNDIGSWRSIWEVSEKSHDGNVKHGPVVLRDTSDSLAWSGDDTLITLVGVKDIVVVAKDGALLVADKNMTEAVKDLTQELKGSEYESHLRGSVYYRPWGFYQNVDQGEGFLTKRLCVYPNARLSLQHHNHRAEHWVVVHGCATVFCDDQTFDLKENQSTFIPKGSLHRLENKTEEPIVIIEIQSGLILDEEDIVRYEDDWGRDK